MRIRVSGHARTRMRERGIEMEDIERALLTFDMSESMRLDADPGKSRIVGAPQDGERLHVVIVGPLPPGLRVQVASVYWKREGGPR